MLISLHLLHRCSTTGMLYNRGEVSKSIAAMSAELDVGSVAPDFTLSANDGREIRLVDFRDKALVVLYFLCEYN